MLGVDISAIKFGDVRIEKVMFHLEDNVIINNRPPYCVFTWAVIAEGELMEFRTTVHDGIGRLLFNKIHPSTSSTQALLRHEHAIQQIEDGIIA